jgi:hypothetical protein
MDNVPESAEPDDEELGHLQARRGPAMRSISSRVA